MATQVSSSANPRPLLQRRIIGRKVAVTKTSQGFPKCSYETIKPTHRFVGFSA